VEKHVSQETLAAEPRIFPRSEHPISRKDIDEDALRVLYKLSSTGHAAYLVGGGVRDLFLQKKPKDFDVGTDARPSRLKRIFRNSRIIGRRFRIAHVFFPDGKIIEVSTFRRGSQQTIPGRRGPILRDNEYGTPQEDALRRDLTINGLFYDIESFSVIDYVGGVQDLKDRIIRTIADPDASFKEDPVRMIRAQRHATRTGFEIEPRTLEAIHRNREEIRHANTSRLMEEVLRDLRGGFAFPFFRLLLDTRLMDCLLPALATQVREHPACGDASHPLWGRMEALDSRIQKGATYTPAVLLSLLLHTLLFPEEKLWSGAGQNPPDVWRYLSANFHRTVKGFRVSRRDMERMAQILITYPKLLRCVEHRRLSHVLVKKPYLSEALDFVELDLEAHGRPADIVKEWRRYAPTPPQPEPRYPFARADGAGRVAAGEEPGAAAVEGLPDDALLETTDGWEADEVPTTGDRGGELPPRRRRRRRRRHRSRRQPQ
jgi:poly(A) polymerase